MAYSTLREGQDAHGTVSIGQCAVLNDVLAANRISLLVAVPKTMAPDAMGRATDLHRYSFISLSTAGARISARAGMSTCGEESAPRSRCEQLGIRCKPRCLGWVFKEVEYAGVHVLA